MTSGKQLISPVQLIDLISCLSYFREQKIFLTKATNVIHYLRRLDDKFVIGGYRELAAGSIGLELSLIADLYAADAGGDLHQFGRADVEGERAGQDHADGLARAIRE